MIFNNLKILLYLGILILINARVNKAFCQQERPRVIVTTDGEADDRASMVRFLLTSNEFEVEGIINSSSQFHWVGGEGWHAFHPVTWVKDFIEHYGKVYNNLVLHDPNFPKPEYLLSKWKVGNIDGIGEDDIRTQGAALIAQVLLDDDPRPVWIQAWGGCNTISRALKNIQEDHPEKMQEVAAKMRLFLIWEQDTTYQEYIRPNWEHFNIPTIISDQFDCLAYIWPKVLPKEVKTYFEAEWMTKNILNGHGPLCDVYENNHGAFNAEGDTPSFLYNIPNGLQSMESPNNGGWGGRYVKVRHNVWMDPLPDSTYTRPTEQWGFHNSWSKKMEHDTNEEKVKIRTNYFKPIWRWLDDVQNDFAARADWCVMDYASANHHPIVRLKNKSLNIKAKAGSKIKLDARPTLDPDGDGLSYKWWHYNEADTYTGKDIQSSNSAKSKIIVPKDAKPGETIHLNCEVSDSGTPKLTRYQRVVIEVIP
ncbi:nucleoside hydrolase-like domain-containing protein [Flavobacteriaceae bacterium SZ-1-7]|uniref:nucleoside hydrolase-like domain-containing protein n=1 Tax=Tamlana sedimenti TaxID=3134126 RepID=UPI00312AB29A